MQGGVSVAEVKRSIGSGPDDQMIREMSDMILQRWILGGGGGGGGGSSSGGGGGGGGIKDIVSKLTAKGALSFLDVVRSRASLGPLVSIAIEEYAAESVRSGSFASLVQSAAAKGMDPSGSGRAVMENSFRSV